MSTSVAEIGKKAFDAVARSLSGVVHSAVITTDEKGTYNTTTASYDASEGSTHDCRLIVDKTPKDGKIGTYTITEKEQLVLVEGCPIIPSENMKITFNGVEKTITFVDDILFSGTLFSLVVK
jgi:flagellar basal body rod protein FlgG